MDIVHTPVLLKAVLDTLVPRSERPFMLDGTLGEGGHAEAFLSRYPSLRLLGLDADPEILKTSRERLSRFGDRVAIENVFSFDYLETYPNDLPQPDLMLFDLGISMFHYEKSGRGFAFRTDEPLDMRISPSLPRTAADIVNESAESALADLIFQNGEERYSRGIARAIIRERSIAPIRTSGRLAEVVASAVPAAYRRGPIHPATRTFQALRIAVNGELDRLPVLLERAVGLLAPGGRVGVITFHSLEDRIVKRFFAEKGKDSRSSPGEPESGFMKVLNIVTKKPIVAEEAEILSNPSSRSAKLRVAEKLPQGIAS
jgi:16S rRNA (cytosine1402-N4)-methyltransferase